MSLPVCVLAGGRATRLGDVARDIPKILIDVEGKPFAYWQLEWLREGGVIDVVYAVGYLSDHVREALGDGSRWGMRFTFVEDGAAPLGTGGAVRRALPQLGVAFLVLYGDSYLRCSIPDVARAFTEAGRPALMTVFRNDNRWDTSNVEFADGRIVRHDKLQLTPDMHHLDYGLGVLTPGVFEPYDERASLDLSTVYRDLAATGQLAGYEVFERFYEIGSVTGLAETRALFARRGTRR